MDTNTVTEEPIPATQQPAPDDFEPTEPDPIAASASSSSYSSSAWYSSSASGVSSSPYSSGASDASSSSSASDTRPRQRPPLLRPFNGRILTGVAAGLADYLDIDVTIVRVAFCVLAVIGGAGI